MLTPRELAGGNASKNVGRQAGLPTQNVGNFGRQAGLPTFYVDDPDCLLTFNVGNPACLPTILEALPPPVREGLIAILVNNNLPTNQCEVYYHNILFKIFLYGKTSPKNLEIVGGSKSFPQSSEDCVDKKLMSLC